MAATASNQPSDLGATGTRLALGAMAAINQVLLKSESAAVSEQMVAANRIQVLLENVITASYVLVESVKMHAAFHHNSNCIIYRWLHLFMKLSFVGKFASRFATQK